MREWYIYLQLSDSDLLLYNSLLELIYLDSYTQKHWKTNFVLQILASKSSLLLVHPSQRLTGELIGVGRPTSSWSLSTHSLNISETTGPVKVKFHMEPLWDGETKVCSDCPGHMTKMAAMPIYGKNLKKSSFSGTKMPMTFNLGLQHWLLGYYQIYSNDGPWLTLTYFTARSDLVLYAFIWEKGKTVLLKSMMSKFVDAFD